MRIKHKSLSESSATMMIRVARAAVDEGLIIILSMSLSRNLKRYMPALHMIISSRLTANSYATAFLVNRKLLPFIRIASAMVLGALVSLQRERR